MIAEMYPFNIPPTPAFTSPETKQVNPQTPTRAASPMPTLKLKPIISSLMSMFVFSFMIRKAHSRVSKSAVDRLSFLREMLSKIHFIKAQAFEEMLLRKLDGLQELLRFRELQLKKRLLQPAVP